MPIATQAPVCPAPHNVGLALLRDAPLARSPTLSLALPALLALTDTTTPTPAPACSVPASA